MFPVIIVPAGSHFRHIRIWRKLKIYIPLHKYMGYVKNYPYTIQNIPSLGPVNNM